jgi:UDP-N-acetylmuramate--alanine ligase
MIDLKNIQTVYFIGIGGIGMSALARFFSFHGKKVSGYDKTETPLTKQLLQEGIDVHYEENVELIPKNADIVVYTPAVPKQHAELLFFQQNNYTILKRSDVLGIITNGTYNICVAGTHGKTTMSSMIAHILRDTGYGCNAFLGGIVSNYNTNYWSDERSVSVAEADEYDRSFLKLHPDIAVITAMDADHLDIYGTEEAMQEAFVEFSGKLKPGGLLISKHGLPKTSSFQADRQLSYSLEDSDADLYAANIRVTRGSYEFDVVTHDWQLKDVRLNMGGLHNVENVIPAISIAHELGIEDDKIKYAVAGFKGVKRRFEYVLRRMSDASSQSSIVFIDDYAHHPEELRALIHGARNLFPVMKSTVIFQPHLFTRTRDLAGEFAKSLSMADEVILLPIYPARELPIEGVTSELIYDKLQIANKWMLDKAQVLDHVKESLLQKNTEGRLIITAGAGDIDRLVQPIKEIIEVV